MNIVVNDTDNNIRAPSEIENLDISAVPNNVVEDGQVRIAEEQIRNSSKKETGRQRISGGAYHSSRSYADVIRIDSDETPADK